ncbi:protease modulator HflC [bacterium]|nr:protease modulator HflC [candidate division CSSED10-310 bacterium]
MKARGWLITGIGLGALIVLIFLSLYTVGADEFAVVTVFGKPMAVHKEAGLYVKWPFPISLLNRFDRRLQIHHTELVEYLTKDKKNIIFKTFVCWRISDPLMFFQAIHDVESASQKLDDIVCSLVASSLGDHQFNQIISVEPEQVQLNNIAQNITQLAQSRASDYGLEVVYVGFSRLALPEDNARSVYRRMIAERSSIANEYRAKGRQKAMEIRAEADKQKSNILAEAYKQSEIIKGEGDALAAEIYGSAYAKAPEFFRFMRTLEADKKILGSKTTVILSADSELFSVLKPKE